MFETDEVDLFGAAAAGRQGTAPTDETATQQIATEEAGNKQPSEGPDTKPKAKPKANAKVARATPDNELKIHREPGQVTFPAALPVNVVSTLREWMIANKTNIVPIDIYFMQSPWIEKLHDAPRKEAATDAAYYHALSGRNVEVKDFSLPSMLTEQGGKNSQRLLVVSSDIFPEPAILARIKKGVNEFRIWRGVNDDPYEQAVVVKQAKKEGDSPRGQTRSVISRPTQTLLSGLTISIIGKRKRDAPADAAYPELIDEEEEYAEEEVYGNSLVPSRRHSVAIGPLVTRARTLGDVAHDIAFRFRPATGRERVRKLLQCNTFIKFFTNAVAGQVIAENDPIQVLQCTWCVTNSVSASIMVVDEQDFEELLALIVADEAWVDANAKCFIDVTR